MVFLKDVQIASKVIVLLILVFCTFCKNSDNNKEIREIDSKKILLYNYDTLHPLLDDFKNYTTSNTTHHAGGLLQHSLWVTSVIQSWWNEKSTWVENLNPKDLEILQTAALIHDIGKGGDRVFTFQNKQDHMKVGYDYLQGIRPYILKNGKSLNLDNLFLNAEIKNVISVLTRAHWDFGLVVKALKQNQEQKSKIFYRFILNIYQYASETNLKPSIWGKKLVLLSIILGAADVKGARMQLFTIESMFPEYKNEAQTLEHKDISEDNFFKFGFPSLGLDARSEIEDLYREQDAVLIKKIKEVLGFLDSSRSQLVVFDLDHTLILDPEHFDGLIYPFDTLVPSEEPDVPNLLKELHTIGIPVLGLTFRQNLNSKTISEMNRLGISFSDWHKYMDIPKNLSYASGIIFTKNKSKGPILDEFLRALWKKNSSIKNIIVVDDKLSNLASVSRSLEKYKNEVISYKLLHYVGAGNIHDMNITSLANAYSDDSILYHGAPLSMKESFDKNGIKFFQKSEEASKELTMGSGFYVGTKSVAMAYACPSQFQRNKNPEKNGVLFYIRVFGSNHLVGTKIQQWRQSDSFNLKLGAYNYSFNFLDDGMDQIKFNKHEVDSGVPQIVKSEIVSCK